MCQRTPPARMPQCVADMAVFTSAPLPANAHNNMPVSGRHLPNRVLVCRQYAYLPVYLQNWRCAQTPECTEARVWRTSEGLASVFTYEHSASQLAGRLSLVADLSTAGSCWRFHTQKCSNQDFVFQRGMLLPGLAFLLFSWHRVLTNSQNAIVGGFGAI
ncbi:hypothetical protein METSCH_C01020 [Metschnikowia aff. pulcherrima]|uniref:Uncharacterized protein n=1 Tax=Metschnikowia aff. pulcherrima TaxID=2163413 RepID=A0A4P6XMQ2_9ASCO|nr:hypothetical protein METSCH_C01020 [Metschnikowia aff. pulcherrima]